jgi:hypothetical protein
MLISIMRFRKSTLTVDHRNPNYRMAEKVISLAQVNDDPSGSDTRFIPAQDARRGFWSSSRSHSATATILDLVGSVSRLALSMSQFISFSASHNDYNQRQV